VLIDGLVQSVIRKVPPARQKAAALATIELLMDRFHENGLASD
jgi:hypothetical protein